MRQSTALYILAILCNAACVVHSADKTLSNKELGFEISHPDSWVDLKNTEEVKKLKIESPQADGAVGTCVLSFSVYPTEAGLKAKEYLEQIHADNEKLRKTAVSSTDVKLAGVDAVKTIYETDLKRDGVFRTFSYIVVANKNVYTITTTMNKDDCEIYAKAIQVILDSLKLLK